MRKFVLCALALGLIAARSPAPTDPVAVYVGEVQHLATEAAATVVVTGLKRLLPTTQRTVQTGKTFWVECGVDVGAGGTVLNMSGSLYYDSLLVRPTGRMQNPSEEAMTVEMTNGTARAGECGVAPANHAAIAGISWKRIEGVGRYDANHPVFKIEFLAFSPGTATFTWTDPFADCLDATVADGDFDRKPHGVIWESGGAYYTAVASDGGSYANSDLSVTVAGTAKGKGDFWKANPESLEVYVDLGPTIQAADLDIITVPVSVWFPFKIGAGDSICFTIVWETQELSIIGVAGGSDKWSVRHYDTNDGLYWWNLVAADTAFTSICGLDSAGAMAVCVSPSADIDRDAVGLVANVRFQVLRDGNATAKIGCWISDVPELGAVSGAFPPFNAVVSYKSGDRTYLMQGETAQQTWKWRYGSRGTVVVQ